MFMSAKKCLIGQNVIESHSFLTEPLNPREGTFYIHGVKEIKHF